ncbi:MAG: RNA pyrophosphohydrolase [Hyphomicrobiaceae bacterium]|nr:MAG: RNA pyrophosphohydrolase [Hyphomicrobiaceae bacterium]
MVTTGPSTTLPYRPCVGIMLLNAAGLVWIGRRVHKLHDQGVSHFWQMPQGGIDKGEAPEAAARRELYEETGARNVEIIAESRGWLTYDLPAHLVGIALKGKYRGQQQKWFAMRHLGEESEFDIAHHDRDNPEFDAWRWARIDELPALIVPFKRAVYLDVIAEFRHLAA